MTLLNQFSFVLITIIVLVGLFVAMRRIFKANRRTIIITEVVVLVVALAGFFALRPGSSDVQTFDDALAMLENGNPTFLEFFSNYCAGCLAAKPAVDSLVSEIGDDFNVLRVDIHTDLGRELRRYVDFSFTPEFILFDTHGVEIWRDHVPPSEDNLAQAIN